MNTNKAPDKIYVREFAKGLSQMWSGIRATQTSATAQHEYIRKDALLEWIEKEIQALSDGSLSGYYISLAYKDMIEHLNEM